MAPPLIREEQKLKKSPKMKTRHLENTDSFTINQMFKLDVLVVC